MDAENKRVTGNVKWANDLCPKIKGDKRGLAQICAPAQANMAREARQSHAPVVQECDAGMAKVAVPIFADGEFLGTAGGCGKVFPGEEIDSFHVSKVLECDEEEVRKNSDVAEITRERATDAARWLQGRIRQIVESST
jgi:ligand-binding sensor protein